MSMVTLVEPPPGGWRTSYDAARRFSDDVAIHQLVLGYDELLAHRFMAVRLEDGWSDGIAYESRDAAARHQTRTASYYCYFQIPPEPFSAQVADWVLWYARQAYRNGWREDPNHDNRTLILPTRIEDA